MDLGAYAQIEDLEKIAKKNHIKVDRLRGYRLMAVEEKIDLVSAEKELREYLEIDVVTDWIHQNHNFEQCWSSYNRDTYKEERYYVGVRNKGKDNEYYFVRWDRLDKKDTQAIKDEIEIRVKKQLKQWKKFNKYAGRNDVLYIHTRLGGGNWKYFKCNETVKKQPWYLDHVYDGFDSTYCDIYAKIKPVKIKKEAK